MYLTKTINPGSLVSLIEYKTPMKNTIYYENNFGMIKNHRLMLHTTDLLLNARDVSTITLSADKKEHWLRTLLGMLGVLALLVFIPQNTIFYPVILSGAVVFLMVLLLTQKQDEFYLRIILHNSEMIIVPVKKSQRADAISLIKEFNIYHKSNK